MKTYYTFKAFGGQTIYRRLPTGVDVVEYSSYITQEHLFETKEAAEALRKTLIDTGDYHCWDIQEIVKDDRGHPLMGVHIGEALI